MQIGRSLESSIEILSGLAACFDTAIAGLKNDALDGALQSLAGAAGQVAMLGSDQSSSSGRFADMQGVADRIAERIAKMHRSLGGVDSLAINSRIAAASIRGSTIDFTEFADEIARTLKLARSNLESFGSGLQTVRANLGSAHAGQVAFEKDQSGAIRSVPQRLTATVNAMPQQHKRNAQAIGAVGQRSERIRQQVRSAINALQAGDTTRQRLEHADSALCLLMQAQDPADRAALPQQDQPAFAQATCRLQSAQLAATVEELERNVRQIAASLQGLASEARALRALANTTYGSGGSDRGTFIGDLETQVAAALSLFENYGSARAQAAQAMRSVAEAAEGLHEHLRVVQSLEDDIRIMGLNTTLKCARLGPEGRPLGLIAQELRAYGNEFAREAKALIGEVQTLADMTGAFASTQPDTAGLVTSVMQAMTDSLASLRQVGRTLDDTLSTLERDSERVCALLEDSVTRLGANDDIAATVREAVGTLQAVAPDDGPIPDLTPQAAQLLDKMARTYTMANERRVHERVLGRAGGAALAVAPAATADLEDMLF